MKNKKFIIAISLLLIIVIGTAGYFLLFYKNYSFEAALQLDLPNSSQHENATWWGYNQSKIVSIGDTAFTYYIDNSTQINGMANKTNPNKAVFLKIKDGKQEEFGYGTASRPCNVLADTVRNKVYYIIIEPTSEIDNGATGRTMIYEYDFDSSSGETAFVKKEEIIPSSEVGKIRTSATIDSQGNIAIAYGDYYGYMQVYICNIDTGVWTNYNTLSNNDNDTLLYPYIILKDLNTFYLLAVQDTNVNGTCYYQYIKFFSYENGAWNSQIIVDYRELEIAKSRPAIVEHTDFYADGEDIHIFTRAYLDENQKGYATLKHFVYNNGIFSEMDIGFLSKAYNWVKLVKIADKYYYVCNEYRKLDIIDYETQKIVYSTNNIPQGSYIYVNKYWNNNGIEVMLCPGSSSDFDVDTKLLIIRPKENK